MFGNLYIHLLLFQIYLCMNVCCVRNTDIRRHLHLQIRLSTFDINYISPPTLKEEGDKCIIVYSVHDMLITESMQIVATYRNIHFMICIHNEYLLIISGIARFQLHFLCMSYIRVIYIAGGLAVFL